MKRIIRILSLSILTLLMGIMLLFSVTFAFLQTEFGKDVVKLRLISLAAEEKIELKIGSIHGRLPFRWKFANVSIRPKKHLTITIEKVKVRIGFFSLLKGELFCKSLKLFHLRIDHPSLHPPPALSVYGKGMFADSLNVFQINLKAQLDADPNTQANIEIHSDEEEKLAGTASFSTPDARSLLPYLYLPLDGPISMRADFAGPMKGPYHLKQIDLHTPLIDTQGEFVISRRGKIENATATFQLHYPIDAVGNLLLKDNHFRLTTISTPFTIGYQEFSSLTLSLNASQSKKKWLGELAVTIESETLPIDLTAKLLFDPIGDIAFRDLYLLAPETEIGGKLFLHFPDYSLDGALFAQVKDLSLYSKLWPHSRLKGQSGGEITFSSNPLQTVGVHLTLNHFGWGELNAEQVSAELQAYDLFTTPKGICSIDAERVKFRNLALEQLTFQTQSKKKYLPFELVAKGVWEDPLSLFLKGAILPGEERKEIQINSMQAEVIQKDFKLQAPFTIAWNGDSFDISPYHIDFSGGRIEGACSLSHDETSFNLKSEHFPLELLSIPISSVSLSGAAGIDLDFKASKETLTGHLNILLEKVKLFQFGKDSPLIAKGSLSANLDQETLQLHSHLLSSGHQFFITSATLPISYSHFPPRITIEKEKPISGELFLDGHIEELFDFIDLGGQELKGHVLTRLFLSNRLSTPHLKGTFRLIDGSYENYNIGTSLREIKAEMTAEKQLLILDSFSAKGPKEGTLKGTGSFSLSPEERFPFHFDATLEKLSGIDFDMVSASLTGPLQFDGSLKDLLIHGKLSAVSTEIKIPDELPVDIPNLPLKMINPPAHLDLPPQVPRLFPLRYDLKIKASDHVFVRGRGLTSEWKGKTHIKGEYGTFTAEGHLSLVRGEFNFSGQIFSLTKGEITFSESGAQIDLRGNLQTSDALITAILSGSLTAPSLTFQSIPSMPTSSILARLIFNKDISEITPFQAIQLAQMIVTLSGDTGPNLLEKIRRSLGVDRFNLVSSGVTGDEISLQIGKYLTQGVMVTLSQSANSSQVIVEVELKGGFIFQAETQEEEEGKFSLKWNHNY